MLHKSIEFGITQVKTPIIIRGVWDGFINIKGLI